MCCRTTLLNYLLPCAPASSLQRAVTTSTSCSFCHLLIASTDMLFLCVTPVFSSPRAPSIPHYPPPPPLPPKPSPLPPLFLPSSSTDVIMATALLTSTSIPLHRHALESVFSFCSLPALVLLVRVSKG
jgi:hypothetical protein